MTTVTLLFSLVLTLCVFAHANEYKLVCYYTNWSQYWQRRGKFLPKDVDPFLCTHINYAFAKITDGYELGMYEWNDEVLYKQIVSLKQKNANLKVLLSVGGWTHENGATSKFSTMVNNDMHRRTFIKSSVSYLRKWNFDGLDVDWEYPTGRSNSPAGDKQRYTQLISELLQAFQKDAGGGKARLLLTAAVPVSVGIIESGYEVEKLASLFDWINLMSYDMHVNTRTSHHTAMNDDGGNSITVPSAVDNWVIKGFPPNKITLGLAAYGRSFTLQNAKQNGLGASVDLSTNRPKGPFTGEHGLLAYYEICGGGYTVVEKNAAGAPYAFKGKDWICFDSTESVRLKVVSQIKEKALAGAMVWALPLDDFSGTFCNNGKYPFIKAIYKALDSTDILPPPEPTDSPATISPSTTDLLPPPEPTDSPETISTTDFPETPIPLSTTELPLTTPGGPEPVDKCQAFGLWKNDQNKQAWCGRYTCHTCPKRDCRCGTPNRICTAAGPWKGQSSMNDWCETNCALNYCPSSHCKCSN